MLKRLWLKLIVPTSELKDQNAGMVVLFAICIVCLLAPLVWHQFVPAYHPEDKTEELALLKHQYEAYQDSLKLERKRKWQLEHPVQAQEQAEKNLKRAQAKKKVIESDSSLDHHRQKQDRYKTPPKPRHLFELNTATKEDLVQVKGIGNHFASRIIKFRESLGGFHSANQLYDVYKLDSAVVLEAFKHLKPGSDFTVRKLNVNTAEFKKILKHPYLAYPDVQQIFNNRPISQENLCEILPDKCEQVRPYLRYE